MFINLYKEADGRPQYVARFRVKEKDTKFSTIMKCVEGVLKDFYGAERVRLPEFCLYSNAEGKSTFHIRKGDYNGFEGRNRSLLSAERAEDDIFNMTDVIYTKDGEEHTEKFGVDIIFDGFVIETGKEEPMGIFGFTAKTYFVKLTTKRVHSGAFGIAKRFATAKAALQYVSKYENVFRYMAVKNGWCPSVMYASDTARQYMEEGMTEKKIRETNEALDKVNVLLSSFIPEEPSEPEHVYGDTPEEEALLRMKELQLLPDVLKAFKKGEIFLSEFAGMIYTLNDGAKDAVRKCREKGDFPYHVIKTGEMYSVLCVTPNREDWHYERYNPADGNMDVFVKNGYIEEFGSITVQPINGGVMRTA